MKSIRAVFALPILAIALASMPAMAQDQDHHDNHTYKQHSEWKAGAKIKSDDWNRGDKVDYRQNHLSRPAAGHEWRQVDGNFVLANQNGVIVSVRHTPHN